MPVNVVSLKAILLVVLALSCAACFLNNNNIRYSKPTRKILPYIGKRHQQHQFNIMRPWLDTSLMMADGNDEDYVEVIEGDVTTADSTGGQAAQQEQTSVLDKINAFLDTPILDANDSSDQGPVQEALKEFVRDEPELAQITFSVVTVVVLGAFALFLRRFM